MFIAGLPLPPSITFWAISQCPPYVTPYSFLSDDTTYIAVYDYNPSESSPNIDKDEELVLRKGDIVKVLGDLDDDGFYYAKVNGRKGYVPSNYLSKLKHST